MDVDERELERFEREGVLRPAARVILPEDYVRVQAEQKENWYDSDISIPGWEDLQRVWHGYGIDRRLRPAEITDEFLPHPIDWEFEHGNRHLTRPDAGAFRAWHEYALEIEDRTRFEHVIDTAKHYYHYWQVYPLYAFQKRFPVFARHPHIIAKLKEVGDDAVDLLVPQQTDALELFGPMAIWFDALSYYIEMYTAEETRTFQNVRALDSGQLADYRERLASHAKLVLNRFQLNIEDAYGFLSFLLNLRDELRHDERTKLADMLENDLLFATRLTMGVNDKSFEAIEQELTNRGAPFWLVRDFRHLDKAIEIYDYAQETFLRLKEGYNGEFPALQLTDGEITGMLNFVENVALFILPFAIFDLDETINSPKRFHLTSRYIGLKNLTTGLEGLLRELAKRAPGAPGRMDTLESLVPIVFPVWEADFQRQRGARNYPTQPSEFAHNIMDVYTDASLNAHPHGNILRQFLIAYWSRNLTGHHYTLYDELYGELYGIIYRAICYTICYSWLVARQNGWV